MDNYQKDKNRSSFKNNILKKMGWTLMATLALLIFVIAGRYLTLDPEVYFEKQKSIYIAQTFGIIAHIAGSMLAIIIGPFQFLKKPVTNILLKLHRWMGRIYLLGVLSGGLAGLYMSFFAHGGLPASTGFFLLALCWLVTGFMAYKRIRNKEVLKHQQWMIRNYALTFAAVTLRLWLPVLNLVCGFEFTESYITVAWLCWVPNLLVAEWIVNRINRRNDCLKTT